MERVSLAELIEEHASFDAAVDATTGIDKFCSSTDWILPASKGLMPPRSPWLFRGTAGYIAMMRATHEADWRSARACAWQQPLTT